MQTVKCKTCGSEIILTNDKDLPKWKEKGEICSRCDKTRESGSLMKHRHTEKGAQKIQKAKEPKPIDEKELLLKEKFKRLLELREQYFDFMYGKKRDKGIIKEINDFFDTDLFEVFNYYEYDYPEFFNMGENADDGLTWNKLLDLIKKYKVGEEK